MTTRDALRVLLVEDNEDDARLLKEQLAEAGLLETEPERAATLETALGRLRNGAAPPDVVLLDLGLPDATGLEAVKAVVETAPTLPVLVLTGRDDRETAVAALRKGAEDYLLKGEAGPDVLARSIRYAVERKRADRELEADRAHLREVFEEAPAFVATLRGPDHVFEMVNPAYRELVGDRSFIGRPVRDVFPELEDQPFFDILDEVYRSGEPYRAKETPVDLERGGGRERRYLNFVYQPRREDGEVVGVIAHGVDVTEQVEARQQTEEVERRYRTLVETMAEAAVILDREGQFTFANGEAEELLGLEESELTGRTYDDPAWRITDTGGDPFPEDQLPFRRVMETGKPVRNVEFAIQKTDGTRTILSVNAAPMETGTEGPGRVVATMRDVTDRKRLESKLEHQALHDPLTGLANRALFEDRLDQALTRSRRRGEPMALLMVDIDAFKRINDQLGHTAGDRVLEELARRLEGAVREGDTVVRWGGDEFALVLPDLTEPEAVSGAWKRIQAAVQPPIDAEGESVQVDLTAGAVVHADEDHPRTVQARDPEELTRLASLALHWAKEEGPGGFSFYDRTRMGEQMDATPIQRENELRTALERGEIVPHYQPIVRLDDRSRESVEALARWRHPEEGILGPGDFIPLAEQLGLVGPLQELIVRQGCRDLVAREETTGAGRPARIRFNISGQHFRDAALAEELEQMVREAGARPEQVIVEVTETSLMRVPATVEALRGRGFEVSIDDFGTGYSTLTYLRDLDVDELKIDMTFVQGIVDSPSDTALVDTILTLGDRLGLRVVAEGIETEGQLRKLRSIGCTCGQGYLFGRPGPADEIEGLVAA